MRLEIWPRTELTLRTIAVLSGGGRWRAAELAARVDSSVHYVPHVVAPLTRAGWVRSTPGPTGGHELVADLRDVSVLDLVEAVEGTADPGRCVMADRPCPAPEPCALHAAWIPARDALCDRLARTPLATVIPRPEEP